MKKIVFCGGACMYNYHLGQAAVIQEQFTNNVKNIIFEGVSCGSFPALFISLNLKIDDIFDLFTKSILDEVGQYYTGCLFNLYNVLKKHTIKLLPEDSHLVTNFNITATNVKEWENKTINTWLNNEDLVECMLAGGYVPFLDGSINYKYRDEGWLDSCLTYKYNEDPNTLYIKVNMWREIPYSWYWISSNKEWAKKQYDMGRQDTLDNLEQIKDFFINV